MCNRGVEEVNMSGVIMTEGEIRRSQCIDNRLKTICEELQLAKAIRMDCTEVKILVCTSEDNNCATCQRQMREMKRDEQLIFGDHWR